MAHTMARNLNWHSQYGTDVILKINFTGFNKARMLKIQQDEGRKMGLWWSYKLEFIICPELYTVPLAVH